MQEGFALSYHEEMHAFILEYMYTLCLIAFVFSFKTFYKLEKTATTVFCFISNYKYEKIVCYAVICLQIGNSGSWVPLKLKSMGDLWISWVPNRKVLI